MNARVLTFVALHVADGEIAGRRVLEVGSADVNGSVRPLIEARGPREYCGVDIGPGSGVDVICDAAKLIDRFGENSFDVVISTELLEHVPDWRAVVHAMKGVCKPGGVMLVTTRSRGFMYHGYPRDYWRFEPEDMARIFDDCVVETIDKDPDTGVFLRAVKPAGFIESDLSNVALYSMVSGKRSLRVTGRDMRSWHFCVMTARLTVVHILHRLMTLVMPRF